MGANGAATHRSSPHHPGEGGTLLLRDRASPRGGLGSVPSAADPELGTPTYHVPLDPVSSRSNFQASHSLCSEDPYKCVQDLPLCDIGDPSPQPDL